MAWFLFVETKGRRFQNGYLHSSWWVEEEEERMMLPIFFPNNHWRMRGISWRESQGREEMEMPHLQTNLVRLFVINLIHHYALSLWIQAVFVRRASVPSLRIYSDILRLWIKWTHGESLHFHSILIFEKMLKWIKRAVFKNTNIFMFMICPMCQTDLLHRPFLLYEWDGEEGREEWKGNRLQL